MSWLYRVILLFQHTAARSPWNFLKDILLVSCVGCYTVSFFSSALGLTEVWVIRGLFSSLHSPVAFAAAFYQIHDLAEGKEHFVEEMVMRVFWELEIKDFFFLKAHFNSWQFCGGKELEYLQRCEMSVQPLKSCIKAFRSVSLQKQTCQARRSWKECYLWRKTSFKMQTLAQLSNVLFVEGKARYLLAFKQESDG